MNNSEDSSLAIAVAKGDSSAFGQIYDIYIKRIYDFVFYKTSNKETAEDLTSDIFMKALENIRKFDAKKGTLQSWLYQIARNTVIDYYRKQKTVLLSDDIDIASNQNIEGDFYHKQQLETIKKYLNKLTEDQRDIVIMRVWQEMSYKEIAQALGKSEASCKMAFSRIVEKLKTEIPIAILALLLIHL